MTQALGPGEPYAEATVRLGQTEAMEVTEILLPGVGVCYEFQTATGERVGVVAKRDGELDFPATTDETLTRPRRS